MSAGAERLPAAPSANPCVPSVSTPNVAQPQPVPLCLIILQTLIKFESELYLSDQHVEQGRFSRPRRSDDSQNLPGTDRAADALKDVLHAGLLTHQSGLRLGNLHAEADVVEP